MYLKKTKHSLLKSGINEDTLDLKTFPYEIFGQCKVK